MNEISEKNKKLLERINKLKAVINELCSEDRGASSEEEIMAVSHYLDTLIADYMRKSNED